METRQSKDVLAITIRPLSTISEFGHCIQLQREGFGWSDADLMPLRFFVVTHHIGGLVLGAFDGDRMVGFLSSLPGVRDGFSYWHSHILAVELPYRSKGVGSRLKFAQRDFATELGIRWIEWTFDPLEARNAYFNFEKLGVIVNRYYPNFYGETTGTQGGLPTDRVVAEWWVNRERTPVVGEVRRIAIDPDIQTLKKLDIRTARSLQQRLRSEFQKNLNDGFHAVAFLQTPDSSEYVFIHGPFGTIRCE
jgi:predicted GNAT superfamily acetyltransferase